MKPALALALMCAAICGATAGCGNRSAVTATHEAKTNMNDSTKGAADYHLEENTVGWISEHSVAVFNIWARAYARADGTEVQGPAGVVSVKEGQGSVQTVVGVGSRVTIGGDVYDVVEIDDGKGREDQRGFIVLRRVQARGDPAP